MYPFRRILVPTDFEGPASRALEVAIELAREHDASLTLVHVWTIPPVYTEGFAWPVEGLEEAARKALDADLARVRQRLPGARAVLACGAAWEEILAAAKHNDADLIVMGTHGRRGLPRLWLGSVAERVVRTSPIPVLTVRAGAE
jgi:nucleotide-binding universal stress UspA family protein